MKQIAFSPRLLWEKWAIPPRDLVAPSLISGVPGPPAHHNDRHAVAGAAAGRRHGHRRRLRGRRRRPVRRDAHRLRLRQGQGAALRVALRGGGAGPGSGRRRLHRGRDARRRRRGATRAAGLVHAEVRGLGDGQVLQVRAAGAGALRAHPRAQTASRRLRASGRRVRGAREEEEGGAAAAAAAVPEAEGASGADAAGRALHQEGAGAGRGVPARGAEPHQGVQDPAAPPRLPRLPQHRLGGALGAGGAHGHGSRSGRHHGLRGRQRRRPLRRQEDPRGRQAPQQILGLLMIKQYRQRIGLLHSTVKTEQTDVMTRRAKCHEP